MIYKTETLYQAAAILSQSEFEVVYVGVEPTSKQGRFAFVLESQVEESVLDDFITRYTRQQTFVEPRTYDHNLDILRDDSKKRKKKRIIDMTHNPKAKNTDASKEEQENKVVDLARALGANSGTKVTVGGEEYTVKDLKIMDCLVLATKCSDVLSIFVQTSAGTEDLTPEMFFTMISYVPDVRGKISAFFAICCGDENLQDVFHDIEDDELIELIKAISKEVDFKRIKENFTKLDLTQLLRTSTEVEN